MNLEKFLYMNINRIEFMVTYQCSGKCKHCSVGEQLNSSKGEKYVLHEKATKAIEILTELFSITYEGDVRNV